MRTNKFLIIMLPILAALAVILIIQSAYSAARFQTNQRRFDQINRELNETQDLLRQVINQQQENSRKLDAVGEGEVSTANTASRASTATPVRTNTTASRVSVSSTPPAPTSGQQTANPQPAGSTNTPQSPSTPPTADQTPVGLCLLGLVRVGTC